MFSTRTHGRCRLSLNPHDGNISILTKHHRNDPGRAVRIISIPFAQTDLRVQVNQAPRSDSEVGVSPQRTFGDYSRGILILTRLWVLWLCFITCFNPLSRFFIARLTRTARWGSRWICFNPLYAAPCSATEWEVGDFFIGTVCVCSPGFPRQVSIP